MAKSESTLLNKPNFFTLFILICQEYDTDFYLHLSRTSTKIESFMRFFSRTYGPIINRISANQEIAPLGEQQKKRARN